MKKNNVFLLIILLLCACKHPDADSLTNKSTSTTVDKNMSVVDATNSIENSIMDSTAIVSSAPLQEEQIAEVNSIPLERRDGVTYVWIEVNGIPLKFIFDTGASSIFISPAEATVLVRQGTLDKGDILGEEKYQDATGGISIGTVINLDEVKVGNKVLYNVKASVSDNIDSPLLLGQSVLEQFGSIEIDNRNDKIILK